VSASIRPKHMAVAPGFKPLSFGKFFHRIWPVSRQAVKSPDLEHATQYALRRLAKELSPELLYHSFWHTLNDVLPAAERLAGLEGVAGEDWLLLRTAVLYHDVGFVEQTKDHELISAGIVAEVLPRFGYSASQVRRVEGMILATRLPQSPGDLLDQIIADADLDVLGREDFWPRNQALRAEIEALDKPMSDTAWYSSQLNFLQTHMYFTPSARMLRDTQKRRNIALLQAHLSRV